MPLMPKRISRNVARCNVCMDVIESRHRHDLRECSCGKTFVDGGKHYLRRGYSAAGFTELSIYEEEV